MRAARVVVAVALLGVAGCNNFDREDQFHDMRILAVRTDPAEILYSPLFLTPAAQRPPQLPLPSFDVDVTVYAFDPRGGHTETTMQLCPAGVTDTTCRLYDPTDDLAKEPPAARPDIEQVLRPLVFDDVIDPNATPVGHVTPADFRMTFTPNVTDFVIPDDANGNPVPSIFPLLPRVVFQEKNLDVKAPAVTTERAFKRIPFTLDLTSPDLPPDVVQNLASGLGIKLCDAPIPDSEFDAQGRASCLEKRVPNNNPDLVGFYFEPDPNNLTVGTATSDVLTPTVEPSALLRVDPGATLAFTPVFVPGAVERYQVVSFDVAASKIILLNRVEDLACNWYVTRGETSGNLTALQFGPSLGTTWTLPPDAKTGERDSIVLVVLDQRGGTSVGEITVEYR